MTRRRRQRRAVLVHFQNSYSVHNSYHVRGARAKFESRDGRRPLFADPTCRDGIIVTVLRPRGVLYSFRTDVMLMIRCTRSCECDTRNV